MLTCFALDARGSGSAAARAEVSEGREEGGGDGMCDG